MTKKRDRIEKLRRRLAEAQSAVQIAQGKRTQARIKGEREVEEARGRAEARLLKATERLERRTAKAARIESRLLALEAAEERETVRPERAGNGWQGEILPASNTPEPPPDSPDGTVPDA